MSKEKRIPKEYAIVVSLMIFFTIVIFTGAIRVYLITKDRVDIIDLSNIDVIETNTNMDISTYNTRIANSIRQIYDVDVYYGDIVDAQSVNAVAINNNDDIFYMLKCVNDMLEQYPANLVREIEARGYEISVNLVDSFSSEVEALANRNSIGQMKIYISNTENITRALHHEWFHILDYYVRLESDETIAYLNWSNYNPTDFVYLEDVNNITSKYVYDGEPGAYFVTAYAKYSDKEDRAETFAEMVTASKDEIFFNDSEPIKGKINILSRVLRNTFESIRMDNNLVW